MREIAKDGLWVFKLINSCKKFIQTEVADNCISQFENKWRNKLNPDDTKLNNFTKEYVKLLRTQSSKIKSKLKNNG